MHQLFSVKLGAIPSTMTTLHHSLSRREKLSSSFKPCHTLTTHLDNYKNVPAFLASAQVPTPRPQPHESLKTCFMLSG